MDTKLAITYQTLSAACYRLAAKWRSRGDNDNLVIHYQKYHAEYAKLARRALGVK